MKCRLCAAQSRVLATRTSKDGHTVTRTHECFNEHRFTSVQVHRAVYCSAKRRNASAIKTMDRRAALFRRNKEIMKRLDNGEQQTVIAKDYGVSPSTVWLINQERVRGEYV